MEKIPAIHRQFSRAQFPIRSEQKMVPEEPVLVFAQSPARHQREIRDKLLIFPSPGIRPLAAHLRLERNAAQVPLLGHTFYKPVIADPENTAQHAVAGRQHTLPCKTQSRSMA